MKGSNNSVSSGGCKSENVGGEGRREGGNSWALQYRGSRTRKRRILPSALPTSPTRHEDPYLHRPLRFPPPSLPQPLPSLLTPCFNLQASLLSPTWLFLHIYPPRVRMLLEIRLFCFEVEGEVRGQGSGIGDMRRCHSAHVLSQSSIILRLSVKRGIFQ